MGADHDPVLKRTYELNIWYVDYGYDSRAYCGGPWRRAPSPGAVERAAIRAKRKHVRQHKNDEAAAAALVKAKEKMANPEPAFVKVKRLFVKEDE